VFKVDIYTQTPESSRWRAKQTEKRQSAEVGPGLRGTGTQDFWEQVTPDQHLKDLSGPPRGLLSLCPPVCEALPNFSILILPLNVLLSLPTPTAHVHLLPFFTDTFHMTPPVFLFISE
jgi:hypothetical protein